MTTAHKNNDDNLASQQVYLVSSNTQATPILPDFRLHITAQLGAHYRVLAGDLNDNQLLDNVIAVRDGNDLLLIYSQGYEILIADYFITCADNHLSEHKDTCSVQLPSDTTTPYTIHTQSIPNTKSPSIVYTHGSDEALLQITNSGAVSESTLTAYLLEQASPAAGPLLLGNLITTGISLAGISANNSEATPSTPLAPPAPELEPKPEPEPTLLELIGTDAHDGTQTSINATAIQLNAINNVSGALTAKEAAYQAYIDANPDSFSPVATAAEVQTMVNTVNTTTPGFTFYSNALSQTSAPAVAAAGDVNGDGLADIIIGIQNINTKAGQSYVVFGKSDGSSVDANDLIKGIGGFAINGASRRGFSGASVASAGDVNGDGFDDLIIGARGINRGKGESYIVYGKTDTKSVNLDKITEGQVGFAISGTQNRGALGTSVKTAGDFNGDGLSDFIIGAPAALGSGQSYLIFGSHTKPTITLNDLGEQGLIISGINNNDKSGQSVANAGDVNGDGYDDLIVGAPESNINGISSGQAYVIFGSADTSDIALTQISTNQAGFVINGAAAGDFTGYSVSTAGDVNGDGLSDLIIGAPFTDTNGSNSGTSYVLYGKENMTDVDLSLVTSSQGFALYGEATNDASGFSVSAAGDVNGDGMGDLIVGAYNAHGGAENSGRSYVVFGSANSDNLNLTKITTTERGFILDAMQGQNFNGYSVASAGDVNADGLDDLIVTTNSINVNDEDTIQSYVVFGKTDTLPVELDTVNGNSIPMINFAGTAAADQYNGTADNEIILGGSGNDRLAGKGGADVIKGGAGDDKIILNANNLAQLNQGLIDSRVASIDGGSGNDTILLEGSGLTLDFRSIVDNRISNIENIDLSNNSTNGNNLYLPDLQTILDLSEDTNILKIWGETDDTVNGINGAGFVDSGIDQSYADSMFDVYTHTHAPTVELWIEQNISVI